MKVTLVCQGCCCRARGGDVLAAELGALHVTRCLGPCNRSDVVAVVDLDTDEQTWFGGVTGREQASAVGAWVAGRSELPAELVFEPWPADATRARLRAVCRHREAALR